ncbi:MAG: protein kinase domain-containing protein [Acidobacteriota bacterium]
MLGRTISHYLVEEELGRGGMGVVYRARDQRLHRPVALKLLSGDLGQAERRARTLAEARAACALNHPGITTIYEVGEDGEQIFIVMELVAGKTLRRILLEDGRMPAAAVARLATQIAEALQVAHLQGVIHGDIKPENVVIQSDGRAKLLDFGIARQVANETVTLSRTQPGYQPGSALAGTLAYMAPEQFADREPDPRSDLYSLGVVLYELLAGRRPFASTNPAALIAQVLHEPPPPLSPDVPPELAGILYKVLQKNPAHRYQTAAEVNSELAGVARSLEVGMVLPAAAAGKQAIAVLPFKLLTPNPEDDYLSVALADAAINELSASGEFLVRPTNVIMRYGKQLVDPLAAARELNVQVVVDGSIQKFGQRLRVHVQAWNAADGRPLLSAKHEAEMADLFGLQDKIAAALARALGMKAGSSTQLPASKPTDNTMAYELYLRAIERFYKQNRWDTVTAIEMLQNATRLDPRFADAWGRLAQACWVMSASFDPGPKWIRQAEIAIRRALALDGQNPDAHCARGLVLWTAVKRYQNRAALRALREALRLNPGCHPALVWHGCILFHVGLLSEAEEVLGEAIATNPDDAFALVFMSQVATGAGDFAKAEELHARALSLDRANLWANLFAPTALLYEGQLERAEERIRSSQQVVQDPLLTASEALLWAKRGENRKAQQLLTRALHSKKMLAHTHHTWHVAADAYAVLGKSAQALALLQKCQKNGLPNYPGFRNDPHLRALGNDARFVRFVSGLQREWQKYQEEFGGSAAGARV